MAAQPTSEKCSWCGAAVELDDGFRAYEPAGERRAVFCRLEHVVPWSMQGPHWEAGPVSEPEGVAAPDATVTCSHCGNELSEISVLLVRHRGEHRVADYFCSSDHMAAWAKAGGRWQ
jgi:hypothetical protein